MIFSGNFFLTELIFPKYIIKANIVEDDRLQAIPVTTFVDVKSVSWRPDTQQIELEVDGGAVVTMEEIGKITN